MQRILIVKTSSLGDIVQCFPVLQLLKNEFPQCRIDWVVEAPFSDLVKAHPLVNQTLLIDTKRWRKALFGSFNSMQAFYRFLRAQGYDLVIDLQGNTKSAVVTALARAPVKVGFAPAVLPEWPNRLATTHRYLPDPGLSIQEEYLDIVAKHFQIKREKFLEKALLHLDPAEMQLFQNCEAKSENPRILVALGSAWKNKQLTQEGMIALLSLLKKDLPQSQLYFCWGSDIEKQLSEDVLCQVDPSGTLLSKMTLPLLQNVMGRMDLVLSMDSLPLHLAASCGTPTFSLFGASSAAKYAPKGDIHAAFQGICPYGRSFEKRCPILRSCPTGACLRSASVSLIYADLKKHIIRLKLI